MICPNCKAAADVRATAHGNADQLAQVADHLDQRAADLHAQCTGCECQHRTTRKKES